METRSTAEIQECLPCDVAHQSLQILAGAGDVIVFEAFRERRPVSAEIVAPLHA
jgi:hypothetical protein